MISSTGVPDPDSFQCSRAPLLWAKGMEVSGKILV